MCRCEEPPFLGGDEAVSNSVRGIASLAEERSLATTRTLLMGKQNPVVHEQQMAKSMNN
jgi:hypothetical protein